MLVLEAQERLEEAAAVMDGYAFSFDQELLAEKIKPVMEAPPTPASLEGFLALSEGHLFLTGMHILVLGRMKQTTLAFNLLNVFENMPYGQFPPVELAIAMIGLNRFDDAVKFLRKAAFEDNDPYAMWFHIFPPLRHLKGHRGYQSLLKDLKLPVQRER